MKQIHIHMYVAGRIRFINNSHQCYRYRWEKEKTKIEKRFVWNKIPKNGIIYSFCLCVYYLSAYQSDWVGLMRLHFWHFVYFFYFVDRAQFRFCCLIHDICMLRQQVVLNQIKPLSVFEFFKRMKKTCSSIVFFVIIWIFSLIKKGKWECSHYNG